MQYICICVLAAPALARAREQHYFEIERSFTDVILNSKVYRKLRVIFELHQKNTSRKDVLNIYAQNEYTLTNDDTEIIRIKRQI